MSNGIRLVATVIDSTDARRAAEFYRALLGWTYRTGDEPPSDGESDVSGQDWLVLEAPDGGRLSFQQVADLAPSSWPTAEVPQQLHLDFAVADKAALADATSRVLGLGGQEVLDRSDDAEEPLHVFTDLDGHPFCIFVS